MDFAWEQLITLAEALAKESSEAAHRAAISRAYYAVYHLAQARAVVNGLVLSFSDSQHKLTWEFYSNCPDPECQRLGQLGKRLKERRVQADYSLLYRGRLAEEMGDAVGKAAEFAVRLRKLDPRLPSKASLRQSR